MTYSFYITIHALPADASPGPSIELAGRQVRTLQIAPATLSTTTFGCSFEAAQARLADLERMFIEADGSFVWTSPHDGPAWQVDGNLYDRNEQLLFVDVKGVCPAEQFDRLLTAFGWPATPVMFQLVRQAVFLDESEFRRVCESR